MIPVNGENGDGHVDIGIFVIDMIKGPAMMSTTENSDEIFPEIPHP